eukprot:CAMPEP_0203923028 /NCGR_PEP_ID=MMETSP0359-20131031/62983_1 /ASSEMBLY_ACC=CAM_ASM_000338 /TAXON_ID=268821 /ORGANISM="Scrippsiella Hangoei, Strain SHTV-5" /LENGTH=339 /DNA_ID=CAMNT_0050851037 /DNA_START=28 /DNA_END=1047 /DNA_ORIENTATION=+
MPPKAPKVKVAGMVLKAPDAAEDAEGKQELVELIDQIFNFYDEDQDGQIERIEMLDGEEKRCGRFDFGPAVRKKVIAWFKAAGAEGTPTDGMYLSKEKWAAAFATLIAAESGADVAAEPGKVVAWLKEAYGLCLVIAKPVPAGTFAADPSAPREPPTYPITVKLTELQGAIDEAASFDKTVLVLSSGLDQVETYLSYKTNSLVDCKQLIAEMFVHKTKSKEDAQEFIRDKISKAMNSNGSCLPFHIRMANSAFDWKAICGDKVPAELFSKKEMTVDVARKQNFFDDGHKFLLECDDRWKDYYVLITSTFNEEKSKEFLADKFPFCSEFATIIVDPASIS